MMGVTVNHCCVVIFVVSLLSAVGGRNRDKKFSDYIIKARCQAECNGKYGRQSMLPSFEFFDVYRSYTCADDIFQCEQCSLPCNYDHVNVTDCQMLYCLSPACNESCQFFYKVKAEETTLKVPKKSGIPLRLVNPKVTCRYSEKRPKGNLHIAYLRWNVKNDTHSARLPLSFIVGLQQRSAPGFEEPWLVVGKTNFSFVPVKKLNLFMQFRFNVTAVASNGTVGITKRTKWNTVPPVSESLEMPLRVRIAEQTYSQGSLTATVKWKTGPGGGCFFKLYWMDNTGTPDDSYDTRDITQWPQFKYELRNLKFDRNYSVQIHTYDSAFLHSSRAAVIDFRTLSCLQTTNHNYSICEPDPPRNVTYAIGKEYIRDEIPLVDVTIMWILPAYVTPTNHIDQFIVTWRKIPQLALSQQIKAHHGLAELPGNQTRLILPGLHMNSIYGVDIETDTIGGSSKIHIKIELGSPYSNLQVGYGNIATVTAASHDGTDTNWNIYFLCLLPVFVAAIAIIVYCVHRRRCRNKFTGTHRICMAKEELNPIYGSLGGGPPHKEDEPYLLADDREIDFSRLKFLHTLGEGAFGKVMKAELEGAGLKRGESSKIVAVKILKEHPTPDEWRSLLLEMEAMKHFGYHQNVVSMIGCCTIGPRMCLLMDYCPLGDLRNYLREYREKHLCPTLTFASEMSNDSEETQQVNSDSGISHASRGSEGHGRGVRSTSTGEKSLAPTCNPYGSLTSVNGKVNDDSKSDSLLLDGFKETLSQSTLLSYARQIALGMEFLSHQKFVHRDLAARNILLYNHRLLKISDFGLSRDVYETNMYQPTSGRKLPYKWMPLESIFDHVFTIKSDVWSFGIVLWEIVTLGGCPYPGIPNKDLFRLLKDGYRMEKPDNCSPEIYQIMLSCWHPKPEDRPSFAELRYKLEVLLEATQSYIDLTVNVSPDYYQNDSSEETQSNKTDKTKVSDTRTQFGHDHYQSTESGTECSVQSDELEVLCNCASGGRCQCDLEYVGLNRSVDSTEGKAPFGLMRAPSLRYAMVSLLEQMGRRSIAARQKHKRQSLSLSEVCNVHADENPEIRTASSDCFP